MSSRVSEWGLFRSNYSRKFWFMKKATRFSIGVFLISITLGGMAVGQITISSDDASQAAYSDGWTTGDNGGSGFGSWTISLTSGDGGQNGAFVGTGTGLSGTAFGLYANSGNTASATRTFTNGEMLPGDKFTVDIGHTTTIDTDQSIGINLQDDGVTVITLKFVGGASNWVLNDGGSDFSAGQGYDDFADLTFTFTYEGGSSYSYTFGAGSGSNFTATSTISGINGFEIFNANQASGNNTGFNNFKLEGGSVKITGSAGYRLLSSPISTSYSDVLAEVWTQATTGADTDQGSPNVLTWDNTSTGGANTNWTGVTDLSGTITAGEGFLVYVYDDTDFNGSGGDLPVTLSVNGTENAVDASPTVNNNGDGWTLLGNPFATTIDFDNVTTADLQSTIYAWDPNDGAGDGGTDANGGSGSWKTYNGSSGDLTGGLIAPFQGFFVQTATSPSGTPSVTFPSGAKSSGGTFLGKQAVSDPFIRFGVESEGVRNSAYLQFGVDGSLFDRVHNDAVELQPLSAKFAQLAFVKAGDLYDIANIGLPETEVVIPMDFSSSNGGEFILTATDFNLSEEYEVVFHDYEQDYSSVVVQDFSYRFEMPQLKSQAVPPLSMLNAGAIHAKVSSDRFGITIRPTSVSNEVDEKPLSFGLAQNYPNPFNPSTTINYTIENAGAVNLSVYNLMGQRVATLVSEAKTAGTHSVRWNAAGAASGMYYYRLEVNGQSITRKMTLIK